MAKAKQPRKKKAKSLSLKRKVQIKKNFDENKPPKRKNELIFWKRIKAGKLSYSKTFKINGKLSKYPERFLNDFVIPMAKREGLTVREYMKEKKEEIDNIFIKRTINLHFNLRTIEKFFTNITTRTNFYLFNGLERKVVKKTVPELRLIIAELSQAFSEIEYFNFSFKVTMKKSFTIAIFSLPDVEKVLKLKRNEQ
jgi:hypothetical protein